MSSEIGGAGACESEFAVFRVSPMDQLCMLDIEKLPSAKAVMFVQAGSGVAERWRDALAKAKRNGTGARGGSVPQEESVTHDTTKGN